MQLIFAIDNGLLFSKALAAGQCMGMSCDWAKTSLTFRNVYKDALTPDKWDIGPSPYRFGTSQDDVKIIEAFGMEVINGTGVRRQVNQSSQVAEHLLQLEGTCVWGLEGPEGGHAMGFRQTDGVIDLFDPRMGLERSMNKEDLRDTLVRRIDDHYSDLLKWMGIYEVRRIIRRF